MAIESQLETYYHFDQNIVDAVTRVGDAIGHLTYADFLERYKIPEPQVFAPEGGNPIQFVDLKPEGNFDTEHANVLHLPMGSGPTPNKIVRGVALFLANPDERLIITGGPGVPFKDTGGKLNKADRQEVIDGSLRPVVDPTLQLLHTEGIVTSSQLGMSRGTEVAAAAGVYAEKYDQRVVKSVWIEPVAITKRGLVGITKAYNATNAGYKETLAAHDFPLLADSRKLSENDITYIIALLRLTNLAVAQYLGGERFLKTADAALTNNPEMSALVSWGDKTEIGKPAYLGAMTRHLSAKHENRVSALPFKGKHGSVDFIALHSAIMLKGLQPAA